MNHNEQKKGSNIPKVDSVKFIERTNGTIKGYAVNTFHGLVKNYNEDRVSIIMNITKPNFKGRWPRCSYFGVFDGHGGNKCSDFLKQNMHRYITQNSHFPHEPIQALKFGFKKAEQQFLNYAEAQNPIERSGSCALVLLIIDQICYIANVGDSRAILSANQGKNVYAISKDHKPDSDTQKERIFNAGGKIYQSSVKSKNGTTILGPFRIQPGKLSVSRSFGDIQAKLQSLGGNPKVLIAKPQITYFQINNDQHDFIMMCSDGVYDKLQNQQVSTCFWNERQKKSEDKYQFIGSVPSKVIQRSMEKMSMDNLTCLIIVFQDNGKLLLPSSKKIVKSVQKQSVKRPQSALMVFQNQNKNRLNNTSKIANNEKANEQAKTSRSSKPEEQQNIQHESNKQVLKNRENKSSPKDLIEKTRNSHRDVKQSSFKQIKENVEKMIKRKSSANLMTIHQRKQQDMYHPPTSLTSSISAKMIANGSKAFQKSKQKDGISQKLSLNDMMKKKTMQVPKKQSTSLWKQMMTNPKNEVHDKLIRF